MGIATLDLRLSAGTQKALKIAQSVAREHMHAAFSAPHLLKALLHKDLGLEQRLWQLDYDVYYIEEWADVRMESCRKSSIPREAPAGDDDIAGILEEADNIRLQLNEEEVAPMHLLIAVSTPGVGFSFEQLKTWPLQRETLMQMQEEDVSVKQLLNEGTRGNQALL